MRILGINIEELKRVKGYHTCFEMANQPDLWREGVKIVGEYKEKIETFLNQVKGVEGLKIYLVGAGSSAKAASIVQNYLQRVTEKEVVSVPSTTFITHSDHYIRSDEPLLLVSFSSSGNTTEALEAIRIFKEKSRKVYQLLLICSEEGEIVKKYAREEGVLYVPIPKGTKGRSFAATGEFTLLILYALMIFDIHRYDYYKKMFDHIISDAERFFREEIYKVHAVANRNYDTIVGLGSGALLYLASEMCLKVSELTGGLQSTEYHSILEFRHGPKLIMNSRSLLTFFFSPDPHARRYEVDMLKECYRDKKNSYIAALSMDYDEEIDENSDMYIYFNEGKFAYADESHVVFQYSLYLQALAILKSIQLNISPDQPDRTGAVHKVAQGVNLYRKE
ncbi:Phosphosugar isomerase [[Clostridium] ultunense Esp]|nr:Phosphosugar isomerase [[Clostridium] ultunense Esp]